MALNFTTRTLTLNRQIVTATGNNIYVNGLLFGSGLYAPIGSVDASGSSLYVMLTGMSGQAALDYATKAQLTATGATLRALTLGGDTNLSGTLGATGSLLYGLVTGSSGAFNSVPRVNSLNGGTGALQLTGAGNVTVSIAGQIITVSGTQNGGGGITDTVTGTFTITGLDPGGSVLNMVGGPDGGAYSNIVMGGSYPSFSLYVEDFNTSIETTAPSMTLHAANQPSMALSSGRVVIGRDDIGYTIDLVVASGIVIASNITETGAILLNQIAALSGYSNSQFYPKSNPQNYATSGDIAAASGVTAQTLSQSGAALQAIIYGGDSNLSGRLTVTGQTLTNQINSLSGFVGAASGGLETRIAQTGAAAVSYTTSIGATLSGNLTQTGVALGNQITSLSGFVGNVSGVLETRIVQTGRAAVLYASGIGTSISGSLTQSGVQLQSIIYGGDTNLSGNLAQTGATLGSKIDALSGFTTGLSGALQAQISSAGTQVKVSGSATLVTADFSGLGGTIVFTSGTRVFVSGAVGVGGGVPSVNGITSAVTIAGTGGLSVSVAGSTILVSGDQSISGALTQTGVTLGAKIDSLSGFVGQVSGGLEARIAQSGAATVSYVNGVGINLSGNLTATGQTLYVLVTGMSGQANTNYATAANLTLTGQTLRALTLGGDTNLSGNLTTTGQTLYALVTGMSGQGNINYATAANLTLTGQTLYALTTGMSGQANANYATVTNLTLTGQTLYVLVTGMSGQANANYATAANLTLTGQTLRALTLSVGTSLSGNMTTTGQALYQVITGMSGQGVTDYATKTQLTTTGQTLQGRIDSVSGWTNATFVRLTGTETISGAKTFQDSVSIGYAGMSYLDVSKTLFLMKDNLGQAAENINLRWLIDSAAVQSITWDSRTLVDSAGNSSASWEGRQLFDPSTNLSADWSNKILTGATWRVQSTDSGPAAVINFSRLSGVSGVLDAKILATGGASISYANGIGANLSGNLTATGSTLDGRINSLSGFTVNVSGALQAQITAGAGTQVKVSGSATLVTADFTGIGGTLVFWSGGQVFVSGGAGGGGGVPSVNGITSAVTIAGTGGLSVATQGSTILVSGDQSISGALTQTGVALRALTLGGDTNLSGNLTTTGVTLGAKIDSLSGFVGGVSGGLEVRIAQTGAAAVAYANGIGVNLSGNLALTGSNLYAVLTGMSGQGVTDYATKTQLTTTGQTLDNKINSLSGFVGAVSGGLEARIAQTGTASILYASGVGINLSGNLTITGQTLQGRIDSLSGFTVNIVSGGLEARIAQTGAAALAYANGIGTNLSGNLTQTGVTLRALTIGGDTNLSGNLGLTGSNLYILITGMSGQSVTDYATKTNLTLTGQTLDNKINSLSGFTVGVSGALQALIAGGGSVVKVSGSSAIATADFTGIGGVRVFTSGGQVFVSGATAGVGGGVPSVNGITSAVIITGTGNFTTQTIGSTIYISGSVLTTDQQLLFDKSGITSGDDRLRWDYVTGTLEIGNPALNYPDNPLSLGGSGVYLQANIRNRSTRNDASADFIATTDVGSDLSGYINLGINNANYVQSTFDIGSGKDGYLYVNDGNLAIGTASTGDVINFHTAGTRYFNRRVVIDDTGILMPTTGKIRFGDTLTGTVIDSTSVRLSLGTISGVGIAGKPGLSFSSTGWGNTYYQSAFYDNRAKFFSPNATSTQSIWGDTAANVGTLLLTTTEALGDYTQVTPAAGLSAGLSATTATIYRGSVLGLNGFFFSSKFILNTVWASGLATSSYAAPSGCRIFVGLTDQAVATQVGLNEPAGNMIGLNYLWASGGAVGTGQYMQNWAIRSRDNVATSTGTTAMTFQTGFYRFSMFCRPFPNNNVVEWELTDLIRGSGIQGTTTSNLPVGSTAMRPMTALGFVSGIKVIGCSTLYVEKQGSLLD